MSRFTRRRSAISSSRSRRVLPLSFVISSAAEGSEAVPEPNVIESTEGFSVKVLGQTGMRYTEGTRSVWIDSEVLAKPRAIAMLKETIRFWEGPEPEEISEKERDRIANNVKRAFEACGYELQVYARRANVTSDAQAQAMGFGSCPPRARSDGWPWLTADTHGQFGTALRLGLAAYRLSQVATRPAGTTRPSLSHA
jgi:hypothetical protein